MAASGHFYTHHPNVAAHLRFAFYDWLVQPSFDTKAFGDQRRMRGAAWVEYRIYVKDAPSELYRKIAALYVGEEALYPYHSGVCMLVVDDSPEGHDHN